MTFWGKKVEAVTARFSEVSLDIRHTWQCHVPDNSICYIHSSDDLKYYSVYLSMQFCGLFKDTASLSDYRALNWAMGWRSRLLRVADLPRWTGIVRTNEHDSNDIELQIEQFSQSPQWEPQTQQYKEFCLSRYNDVHVTQRKHSHWNSTDTSNVVLFCFIHSWFINDTVDSFPPRRSGFEPGSGQVGFVVDKVVLG
jgi:hypothetical protein